MTRSPRSPPSACNACVTKWGLNSTRNCGPKQWLARTMPFWNAGGRPQASASLHMGRQSAAVPLAATRRASRHSDRKLHLRTTRGRRPDGHGHTEASSLPELRRKAQARWRLGRRAFFGTPRCWGASPSEDQRASRPVHAYASAWFPIVHLQVATMRGTAMARGKHDGSLKPAYCTSGSGGKHQVAQ